MKILVAVDGSPYSEVAISLVKALKIGRKAEVTLLTVIAEHIFLGGHTLADLLGCSAALKTEVRKAEEETALELLARLSKSLGSPGLHVETMAHRGSPADEIIKACRSIRADLVVVGFKGTSDASEFLLGRVAYRVIKYAPCSVLVAKKRSRPVSQRPRAIRRFQILAWGSAVPAANAAPAPCRGRSHDGAPVFCCSICQSIHSELGTKPGDNRRASEE